MILVVDPNSGCIGNVVDGMYTSPRIRRQHQLIVGFRSYGSVPMQIR